MRSNELPPRAPAPHSGFFEEINVFGSATGVASYVARGELLPGAPRGFTWRPLQGLSVAELRQEAQQYREMACTARTLQAAEGLLKLADRFDALADRREHGEA